MNEIKQNIEEFLRAPVVNKRQLLANAAEEIERLVETNHSIQRRLEFVARENDGEYSHVCPKIGEHLMINDLYFDDCNCYELWTEFKRNWKPTL